VSATASPDGLVRDATPTDAREIATVHVPEVCYITRLTSPAS
jgi:hypothetical protein